MTNIERRGIQSVLASVADGVIFGVGIHSYTRSLDAMLHILTKALKTKSDHSFC